MILFCNIRGGISNLIKWFSIIWKDRWWDESYLLELLRFKLILMEKNFREKGIHANNEKDADKMKKCIFALNRLLDFDYHEMIFRYHDRKWGKINIEWIDYPSNSKFKEMILTREKAVTREEKEQEKKEFRRLSGHEEYLIQQDLDYLFRLMGKHIRTWWD